MPRSTTVLPSAALRQGVPRISDAEHYAVSTAEAIPTLIEPQGDGLAVVPTHPGNPSYQRVAEVVARRGATTSGLIITDR